MAALQRVASEVRADALEVIADCGGARAHADGAREAIVHAGGDVGVGATLDEGTAGLEVVVLGAVLEEELAPLGELGVEAKHKERELVGDALGLEELGEEAGGGAVVRAALGSANDEQGRPAIPVLLRR